MGARERKGIEAACMKKDSRAGGLLQSGIVFSAISFATGLGNLAFQAIIGRHLKESGDYGTANSALNAIMPLLALLPSVATFAVAHYIAHFKAGGDSAQLQGLLMGCKKFLIRLTFAGSALAVIAAGPLSRFFHYSESLMMVTLVCTLFSLWAALASALCQGLSWFKRLAFIGFLGMILRVLFGWFVTLKWPSAETAVLASAFALLANLILLFWRKELSLHGTPVSPWNSELVQYLVVSAACIVGGFFFMQGDLLVMQHYFTDSERDAYATAERLAVALPMTVGPLLTVLFTSRSGERDGSIVREQFKLLGLYTLGLMIGAAGLLVLRDFCVRLILGKASPEAAAMIGRLAVTMVFVGLLQALALWSLASRWMKISLLYGGLGLAYWVTLLFVGKSPAKLLNTMPIASGLALGILLLAWFITMRGRKSIASN
jgi:hypothetical protein